MSSQTEPYNHFFNTIGQESTRGIPVRCIVSYMGVFEGRNHGSREVLRSPDMFSLSISVLNHYFSVKFSVIRSLFLSEPDGSSGMLV